jgi:hypothetical protein
MKDLVILVADKNMQFALRGALSRPDALGTRVIDHEFRIHIGRDGGVRATGAELLSSERRRFSHALLVLDHEGCGVEENKTPAQVEFELDAEMRSHWGCEGKAIVIAPELDVWIWGTDNALQQVLGWPSEVSIRDWLRGKGFTFDNQGKPLRPKEALEALVPVHRQPRSSALYERITKRISLLHCRDEAFLRLRLALRTWFPPDQS